MNMQRESAQVRRSASGLVPRLAGTAALVCLLGYLPGCRIERPPTRVEKDELALAKLADAPLPILPQPQGDDAVRVIEACGPPSLDTVTPVYSKYYNGPVRHMEYVGQRKVTLDFIPSGPRAQLAFTEAPLPPRAYSADEVPANTTWRFQSGQMAQVTMITSHRLSLFLPCAGDALSREF